MMRGSSFIAVAIAAACTAARPVKAYADEIKAPSGFTFALPKLGRAWVQTTHGAVIVVEDDSDTLPELQIFVFSVKHEGDLADITRRLSDEVVRPGVERLGAPVKTVKVSGAMSTQAIADASVTAGELTLDGGDRAAFAIAQRSGRSLILLAIPKEGICERGASNFRTVLQGLKRAGPVAKPTAVASPAPNPVGVPKLREMVAIRDITATSTFADKRGMYSAWRVIAYGGVLDEKTQEEIPTTAWCEGKPDEGVGEGVTLSFAAPTRLDEIQIAAGVWRSEQLFASNNKIKSLDVIVDGKTTTVHPGSTRKWVPVPIGRDVSTIEVKINEVAKGKMNDSCISGISLIRKDNDFGTLIGADAQAVAQLPSALMRIQGALGSDDRVALGKMLDFPFTLYKIKHASIRSIEIACGRQAAAGAYDASEPICPAPFSVRPGDNRVAYVSSPEPAAVEITLPSQHEEPDTWRLRWHEGAWHLAAITKR